MPSAASPGRHQAWQAQPTLVVPVVHPTVQGDPPETAPLPRAPPHHFLHHSAGVGAHQTASRDTWKREESMIRGSGFSRCSYGGSGFTRSSYSGVGSTMHSGVHSPNPFTTSATPMEIRHLLQVKQLTSRIANYTPTRSWGYGEFKNAIPLLVQRAHSFIHITVGVTSVYPDLHLPETPINNDIHEYFAVHWKESVLLCIQQIGHFIGTFQLS